MGCHTPTPAGLNGQESAGENSIRKPMLYPLSYEGLRCTFAQHGGGSWSVRLGLAASLQTVCAAPVPRAVNQLIHYRSDMRRRLYGGVVPSQEPEAAEQ
jgi:hypothetical protein